MAYLEMLGEKPSPGVNENEIHFATIIAGNGSDAAHRATLEVLHAYADCHNLEVERYRDRPTSSPNYKNEFTPTLRKWRIHVWQLKGSEATWDDQLKKQYQSTPVFAILSGSSDGKWKPIHEFCERQGVPCLFPATDVPVCDSSNNYTLYFH